MNVIFSDEFLKAAENIAEFIAQDSAQRAAKFKSELLSELLRLDFMPYKFRKSLSFEDENIRDFIFKGFVVPYLIDETKNKIVVLTIFKRNLQP